MFIISGVWCIVVAPAMCFVGLLIMDRYNCATMTNFVIMVCCVASIPLVMKIVLAINKKNEKIESNRRIAIREQAKAKQLRKYRSMSVAELCAATPDHGLPTCDTPYTIVIRERQDEIRPYAVKRDLWHAVTYD